MFSSSSQTRLREWIARSVVGLVILLAGVLPVAAQSDRGSADGALSRYQVAAGDVISVRVFGEEDFSRGNIRLTDAGTVTFPFLGELQVLGMTVSEIEKMIADRLRGRYLVNPRVSVWIEEYRVFYVHGMVEKPGAYPYQPGLNVLKAVTLAGGFRERASMSKIFITREKDSSKTRNKVETSSEVGPGDTIVVEESFF